MKLNRKSLFAVIAAILLSLALVACETDASVDDDAEIEAMNNEITALRDEVETLNAEWDTFQDEWGTFRDDWSVYREEIGLGE